jgi:hypothetical protein
MAAIAVDDRSTREGAAWIGWAPLALAPLAGVMLHRGMPAWAFMWVLAIAIYASLKWASWWRSPMRTRASWARSAGYLLTWPGMDAESFLDESRRAAKPRPGEWAWDLAKTALGALLLWGVAREVPERWPLVRGWGRVGGDGFDRALRQLSYGVADVAEFWRGRCANHGVASVVTLVERVLGTAVESGISPAGTRVDLSAFARDARSWDGRLPCVRGFGIDS